MLRIEAENPLICKQILLMRNGPKEHENCCYLLKLELRIYRYSAFPMQENKEFMALVELYKLPKGGAGTHFIEK